MPKVTSHMTQTLTVPTANSGLELSGSRLSSTSATGALGGAYGLLDIFVLLPVGARGSEAARNHLFHDLVRAAVDALHARVGEQPANQVLIHVAIAAMQLDALVQYLLLHVGDP